MLTEKYRITKNFCFKVKHAVFKKETEQFSILPKMHESKGFFEISSSGDQSIQRRRWFKKQGN